MSEPECRFLHPMCNRGCTKYVCRSHFPENQPLVMEKDVPFCKSTEHYECEQFKAGEAFQEDRIRSHKGCPFLRNDVCGKPKEFWCHGHTPPFIIGDNNNVESCFKAGFEECPHYKAGMDERDMERIKAFNSK